MWAGLRPGAPSKLGGQRESPRSGCHLGESVDSSLCPCLEPSSPHPHSGDGDSLQHSPSVLSGSDSQKGGRSCSVVSSSITKSPVGGVRGPATRCLLCYERSGLRPLPPPPCPLHWPGPCKPRGFRNKPRALHTFPLVIWLAFGRNKSSFYLSGISLGENNWLDEHKICKIHLG